MTSNSTIGKSALSRFPILSLLVLIVVFLHTDVPAQDESAIADTTIVEPTSVAPAAVAPVGSVTAHDNPNDGGGAVEIKWELSPDDNGDGLVAGYTVYRSLTAAGTFEEVGDAARGQTSYQDNKTVDGTDYFYQVEAYTVTVGEDGAKTRTAAQAVTSLPAHSSAQWFNQNRTYCFIMVLIISGSIIFYIQRAKKGGDIFVRKIAGIDAVEEAVGRATEMGRKIFFIPGIQDMNDVQTIAGIAILGRVAQLAAQYETWLEVPVSKSLVMVTARETMKEAYTKVGRPDSYQEAQVHYLTDDQFGYAAAIDGMVVREKPATIFYMGAFFAESLILAETGNAAGAIQIAGTAMPSQLPFFVASCDYTLIGEELFAASAYLSREPRQLGSLKGQDVGKAIFLVAIIVGILLETFGWYELSKVFTVQ